MTPPLLEAQYIVVHRIKGYKGYDKMGLQKNYFSKKDEKCPSQQHI